MLSQLSAPVRLVLTFLAAAVAAVAAADPIGMPTWAQVVIAAAAAGFAAIGILPVNWQATSSRTAVRATQRPRSTPVSQKADPSGSKNLPEPTSIPDRINTLILLPRRHSRFQPSALLALLAVMGLLGGGAIAHASSGPRAGAAQTTTILDTVTIERTLDITKNPFCATSTSSGCNSFLNFQHVPETAVRHWIDTGVIDYQPPIPGYHVVVPISQLYVMWAIPESTPTASSASYIKGRAARVVPHR